MEGINILKHSSKSYIELHVGTYKKLVTNSYVKKRTETWELLNLHRLFELERDFRTGQHSRPNMVQNAPLCHIYIRKKRKWQIEIAWLPAVGIYLTWSCLAAFSLLFPETQFFCCVDALLGWATVWLYIIRGDVLVCGIYLGKYRETDLG